MSQTKKSHATNDAPYVTLSGAVRPVPLFVIVTKTRMSPLNSGSVMVTVAPAWKRSPTLAIRGILA